jgi:hypothetical protein
MLDLSHGQYRLRAGKRLASGRALCSEPYLSGCVWAAGGRGRVRLNMSAGSADDQRKPQHWRSLAGEARTIAESMSDPGQKTMMLSIAEAYVRLAERAELRQHMETTSFGPDALKVIGEAFDVAWAEIAGRFSDAPGEANVARLRLATALLSVASEDSRDVEALKKAALQRMTSAHRSRN